MPKTLQTYAATNRKMMSFSNHQWVLKDAVARGSQPGYVQTDTDHSLKPWDMQYFRLNKVRCLISANSRDLSNASQARLAELGVQFTHYRTSDYHAPSVAHLRDAAEKIEIARSGGMSALVYCGFGQGRTGCFIATWALLKYFPATFPEVDLSELTDDTSLKELFGVEEKPQAQAVRNAVNGTNLAPVAIPPAAPGTNVGTPSGLPLPSGGSNAGMYALANLNAGAPAIANFAGGGSGDTNLLPPLPPIEF